MMEHDNTAELGTPLSYAFALIFLSSEGLSAVLHGGKKFKTDTHGGGKKGKRYNSHHIYQLLHSSVYISSKIN